MFQNLRWLCEVQHGFRTGLVALNRGFGFPAKELWVPRYFFHLCDGRETLIDPEGRDIDDVADLGELALKEARAIISQDALGGRIRLDQYVEVRDDAGKLVYRLPFRDAVTVD